VVIVHLFNLLSGLGLELTLVRNIAASTGTDKKKILFPVIVLRSIQLFFVSIAFYFLNSLILPLFGEGLMKFAFLITVLFTLTNFRDLFYNLLQGLNYFKRFASVQITSAVIRVGLIAGAYFSNILTLENLIYIEVLTTLLAFIVQLLLVPLKSLIYVKQTLKEYKEIVKFSFPLYLNNMLTFAYDRTHLFIIGAFVSPVSVALYDVAYKIPEALKRVFQSFIVVYFPNISKLFAEGNYAGGEDLMNKSLGIFSAIIMFGVLAAFLFGEEIIVLMFSAKYAESSLAFSLLMVVFFLRVISNIMGYSLVSAGYSSTPVKVNSVSSIVSVGGSLLLIPVYGFLGAVYALLGMNIVSQVFYHFNLVRAKIYPATLRYLKPVYIAAILTAAYFVLPFDSAVVKSVYLLIYLLLGWFFIQEFKEGFGMVLKKIPVYKSKEAKVG
jgi:O-antigen/teichoic acid export membrane protein